MSQPDSSLQPLLRERRILIVVGSGGVGKTTTAATLALLAALEGRKVLVLTIDPARRLADALGLTPAERADQEAHRALLYERIARQGKVYAQPFSEGGSAAAGKAPFGTLAHRVDGELQAVRHGLRDADRACAAFHFNRQAPGLVVEVDARIDAAGIGQHVGAKVYGAAGRHDRTAKSVADELWQQTAVVDMRVRQQYGVDVFGVKWKRAIVQGLQRFVALEQAAVDQKLSLAEFEQVA